MKPYEFLKETSPRRFLVVIVALLATGLATTLALNALIDPYDIWHLITVPGLPNRPMQRGHDRMYKAALIQSVAPDAIILGTSRSQVMLDPTSTAFRGHATRVVNAALDGSIPHEARRLLEHAMARAALGRSQVKLVVYGLDLFAFDKSRKPDAGYSEERLLVSDAGTPQPYARSADVLPALLSLDALLATGATLWRYDWPSYLLPTGQRTPQFQERGLVSAGGQRGLFQASERDYAVNYACFEESDTTDKPYRDLQRLLQEASAHDIAVRLYISPVHARHAIVLRTAELASVEQRWKQRLVSVVEQARAGGCNVELWDFSSVAFDEPVPVATDLAHRMRWWWESSHATSALGERMLPRLLHSPATEPIGQQLDSSGLEAWLLELQHRQSSWESAHRADVLEVDQQACSTLTATRRDQCPQLSSGLDQHSPL